MIDDLEIPKFLRRKPGKKPPAVTTEIKPPRTLTLGEGDPLSGYSQLAREEVQKRQDAPEVVVRTETKKHNKFARWREFDKMKGFNPRTQRWDPRLNRVVDDRPLEVLKPEYVKKLRFAKLSGPELVRAYNELCVTAAARGVLGCEPVHRFKSDDAGRESCEKFKSLLMQGKKFGPPVPVEKPAERERAKTEETHMAKKAKTVKTAKKPKAEGAKFRAILMPVPLVDDFRPVRAGTVRAAIVKAACSSARTVDKIAEMTELDRKTVRTHLYCMNRDGVFGYEISADDVVSIKFPGSKTVEDAIKQPEKAKAA